jgi:lactaldehyde dehydrogenase/glycolaldehyde dehydrogenase
MVSLTGSVEGGVAIMHAAADNVTKVSLELGGKAPAIVMADADLELAVKAIHASRIINTGQVCNCAERVYVHESIAAEFIDRMTVAMDKTVVGDPFDAGVEMGPLVSETQLELVEAAVLKAVADGSQLMTGGKRYPGRAGWYYRRRSHELRAEDRHHAEGGFRPGSAHRDLQRLGRGDRARQRLRVRPHLVDLHPRP